MGEENYNDGYDETDNYDNIEDDDDPKEINFDHYFLRDD